MEQNENIIIWNVVTLLVITCMLFYYTYKV